MFFWPPSRRVMSTPGVKIGSLPLGNFIKLGSVVFLVPFYLSAYNLKWNLYEFSNILGENECLQSVFTKFEDVDGIHIVIREANRLRIYSEKGQSHDMFSRIFQILILFPNNDYVLQFLVLIFSNAQNWYIVHLFFKNSWKHVANSIKGEEFVVTLPISVKSMWRSNFGIVMENDISSQDSFPEDISSPTPKLLALHHPLDDFTRIVAKQSRKRSSSSHVFTVP